jgi:tripartite-type tricarboxylate transporter receptor subunit TctC
MSAIIGRVLATGAFLLSLVASVVAQDSYPDQPVKIIVPYAAGGGTDTVLRIYQKSFEEALGGSVFAEYAGGGGTVIGTQKARAARPDGYTLLLNTSAIGINTIILKNRPYTMDDFDIIAPMAQYPYMLVVNDQMPVDDLPSFIKYAKEHPGEINFVTLGQGSPTFLLTVRLMNSLGIKLTPVAYPGTGAAQTDFQTNRVQLQMQAASKQYTEQGNIKILAVASDERIPLLPNVPTFKELGYPEMVGGTWFGLFAPHGVPEPILARLQAAAEKAQTTVEPELIASGHYLVPGGLKGFKDYIDEDIAKWKADFERSGAEKQ